MDDRQDAVAIRQRIRQTWQDHGYVACPHTACALEVLARRRADGDERAWLIAATAHPAKFETVVEPLIGGAVEPPPALAELLARPSQAEALAADPQALRQVLLRR